MAAEQAPGLEDMPDEVLSHIFLLLSPQELAQVELASRRCRDVVVRQELWRRQTVAAHPAIAAAAAHVDASAVPCGAGAGKGKQPAAAAAAAAQPGAEAARRSALFKKLQARLDGPPARASLIARALAASTTDHPQEGISNVLRPATRSRDLTCYWSSRGNEDPDSSECLTFQLAHPLCLVTELALRPFRAWFQWGSPIYAPRAVRFRLGGLACFAADGAPLPATEAEAAARYDLLSADARRAGGAGSPGLGLDQLLGLGAAPPGAASRAPPPSQLAPEREAAFAAAHEPHRQWAWTSPEFEVDPRDELLRFRLPAPVLAVGGYLRIELLGKRQRQAADAQYYACVGYLCASGLPLCNFVLRQVAAPPLTGPGAQQQQQQQQGVAGSSAGAAGSSWALAYVEPDPLLAAGGLAAVSEGGRLAAAARRLSGVGGCGPYGDVASDLEGLHDEAAPEGEDWSDEEGDEEWDDDEDGDEEGDDAAGQIAPLVAALQQAQQELVEDGQQAPALQLQLNQMLLDFVQQAGPQFQWPGLEHPPAQAAAEQQAQPGQPPAAGGQQQPAAAPAEIDPAEAAVFVQEPMFHEMQMLADAGGAAGAPMQALQAFLQQVQAAAAQQGAAAAPPPGGDDDDSPSDEEMFPGGDAGAY